MKSFSPKRLLSQQQATRVCIRSIKESNGSISVGLFFLFLFSRVFISRSCGNHFKIVIGNCMSRALSIGLKVINAKLEGTQLDYYNRHL